MDGNATSSWVFGYGSLIWRPGFEHLRAERATLHGAHRALCIYSHRHRGTPERPGLVFGLVRGGSCHGMAFEVDAAHWAEVRDYLRAREQLTGVYREAERPVRLGSGGTVHALTFLVDEHHAQYAGRLSEDEQLHLVRNGHGQSGANTEYVLNTVSHLVELGIRDRRLEQLGARLAGLGG